ncbi:XrtA/PEP-CTERM system histidine kinase PrsK, partial [Pseudomonadota bacterium]
FAAVLVLFALMFSGQVRAYLKVFLSKHFFSYRYDYRDEWLKLISALEGEGAMGKAIREKAIQSLASIVESPGGALWLANESSYLQAESWNFSSGPERLNRDGFATFLAESQWLVDINEYRENPEIYGELRLPEWLELTEQAWLVIPLFQSKSLFGFILLLQPRVQRNINWEDRDLIKTAATQVSSYLALSEASAELADARQFEAFNRLSAYVVHDLKNVVGQLSLVVSNSKKFSDNKEFVEDAFATVDNAVNKMQKMLAQLRQGRAVEQRATAVKLLPIVKTVVEKRLVMKPCPVFDSASTSYNPAVVAESDRLEAVIEHVVQNAQEATVDDGSIYVRLLDKGECVVIEIEDTGCGMNQDFIRNRLFRPFDTTKGNAGMGIGAYESREFIRALGGDVLVVSEPGKGSMFKLSIPVSAEEGQGL